MKHLVHRLRACLLGTAMAVSMLGTVQAQEKATKLPTPRITPIPTGANAVPVGPDTGTPASSDSVPLGTPINPANAAERDQMRATSAAARAAARGRGAGPKVAPAASSAGCTRATLTSPKRVPPDAAPVALPGSGFVGSSASPSTRASMGKGATPSGDCL